MKTFSPQPKQGKLRELLLEILNTKKENTKKSKGLLTQIKKTLNQESLIIQLRSEYNHIKNLNANYKKYLKAIKRLKELFMNNRGGIEKYSNFIQETYKDEIYLINNFEEEVNSIKEEKKHIIEKNDGIINIKNEAFKILNVKLVELNEKVNINLKEIEKQTSKINSLESKKNEEKKSFLKTEQQQYKKYQLLQNNYKVISNLYEEKKQEIDDNVEIKPVEIENKEFSNKLINTENHYIKLSEEKIKNQNLLEEARNLTIKITNLSSFDELSTRRYTRSTRSPLSSIKKISLFK
jgi:hypothetical protein